MLYGVSQAIGEYDVAGKISQYRFYILKSRLEMWVFVLRWQYWWGLKWSLHVYIYIEAHMATKFCRDPMRSWSNTNTKEVLAGLCVVVQIKRRGLERCVVITTSKWHHHLGACLWDMEASVKENKKKTVVVEVGEEGINSIEGSRRNTCHTHSSMLLGWKSYIRWHGVQHWLTPSATLPRMLVPSGAPFMALHISLT